MHRLGRPDGAGRGAFLGMAISSCFRGMTASGFLGCQLLDLLVGGMKSFREVFISKETTILSCSYFALSPEKSMRLFH